MTLYAINCMGEGCDRVATKRGLCIRCYKRVQAIMRREKITWEQAAAHGLCRSIEGSRNRSRRMFNGEFDTGGIRMHPFVSTPDNGPCSSCGKPRNHTVHRC